ncbi:MAG: peptidyl-prolyl cis-trans isomerase [Woeseiaceae bacterium]
MKKLLREPLLHFLVIGFSLFLLFELVAEDDAASSQKVINVNQDTLLTFLQYRSQSFQPEIATARLNNMSDEDLERLIADFVREEALHREALALGMDQNDYIIKRRLVQSIEFITAGFATAGVELNTDYLASYYQTNRRNYAIDPYVTFTHVFFSTEIHGRDAAFELALAKLDELNDQNVPFEGATRHGDRFLYSLNYVEREPGYIASNFGQTMAEAVFALEANEGVWQGPLESAYGFHLALMLQKTEARIPALEEVLDTVRYDAERDAVEVLKDEAIQTIVDAYEVRRNFERPLADSTQ